MPPHGRLFQAISPPTHGCRPLTSGKCRWKRGGSYCPDTLDLSGQIRLVRNLSAPHEQGDFCEIRTSARRFSILLPVPLWGHRLAIAASRRPRLRLSMS